MRSEWTQFNPYYGPQGQPYAVEITTTTGGKISEHYWTSREAYEARDRALDAGFAHVRILGLPTYGVAVVPD